MRGILYHISRELKITLKDKTFYFWALVLPLLFMFVFGSMGGGKEKQPLKINLVAEKENPLVKNFASKLKGEGIEVKISREKKGKNYIYFPQNPERNPIVIHLRGRGPDEAGFFLKAKAIFALMEMWAERRIKPENFVGLKITTYSEKTIPYGFNYYIPAVIVMMLLFNILLFNAASLWRFRQRGLMGRISITPVGKLGLWGTFFLSGIFIGVIDILVLSLASALLFKGTMGERPLASAIFLLLYSSSVSALSVLLGSQVKKREVLIGLSVLGANLLAALGGCWWPLEIVPPALRKVASFLPTTWTMGALEKIIYFHLPLYSALKEMSLLLLLTAFLSFLSVRYFKVEKI